MRRGWCPGLFEPMLTGDGWLLRVKPWRGRLTATQARTVAAAARRWGNGRFNLTGRGNLQLRGFDRAGAAAFAEAMLVAGLASRDPGEERRRNLVLPPLDDGLDAPAAALERLLADPGLAALPGKVLVLLDRGDALAGIAADLRVELGDDGRAQVRIDGATLGWQGEPAAAPAAVGSLLAAFLRIAPRPLHRLRDVPADRLLAEAGLAAAALSAPRTIEAPVGRHGDAVAAVLAFGQGEVDLLDRLAELSEQHGDGVLRLSPWRSVALARVGSAAEAVLAAAARLGLIVAATDPRLAVTACTGAPRCLSATVNVQSDAAILAARGWHGAIHLSGCAKGCAHPAAAPITLVGRAGRYDLVRHGRADAAPERTGLSLPEALQALAA